MPIFAVIVFAPLFTQRATCLALQCKADTGSHRPTDEREISLGPVNTTGVAGAGSQFFSIRGMRSDAYPGVPVNKVQGVDIGCLLATRDDEMRKTGPGPEASTQTCKVHTFGTRGCGANPGSPATGLGRWGGNRAIRRSRPRPWNHQSLRARPSLARFSLATPTAPVVLTGPSCRGASRPARRPQ